MSSDGAKKKVLSAKVIYTAGVVLIATAAFVFASIRVWQLRAYLNSYADDGFVSDYSYADCQVGVALRLPRAGILGKGRYYVITVVDSQGRVLETLYEGPGGYPDSPQKPMFVSTSGPQVAYEIPECGSHTFIIGGDRKLSRAAANRTSAGGDME